MQLFHEIKNLIQQAHEHVASSINTTIVQTYFEIGKYIVEEEQKGKERADYATEALSVLSKRLTKEFGRGYSETNLRQMRSFYLEYRIQQTLSAEFYTSLSWSHYLFLIRMKNKEERSFYEIETAQNRWSLRELKRQFDSSLYERLVLSSDKEAVKALGKSGQILHSPQDDLKDPYILEFLGWEEKAAYSETDLESAIIQHLESFLLELGKGFTFVARQKRISFDEKHFYIDLVFYNRLLRCFLLIDLKIGELKHQDIGQMQMYVNYYDREMKLAEENATIGLILCKDKSDILVRYTLPENNEQIFAAKYEMILPKKEELQKIIESQ